MVGKWGVKTTIFNTEKNKLTNGIKIWNKLPEKIKILKTMDSFKIMAKSYMLDPIQRESL